MRAANTAVAPFLIVKVEPAVFAALADGLNLTMPATIVRSLPFQSSVPVRLRVLLEALMIVVAALARISLAEIVWSLRLLVPTTIEPEFAASPRVKEPLAMLYDTPGLVVWKSI